MPPTRFRKPALSGHVTLRSFADKQCSTTASIRKGELEEPLGDAALRLGLRENAEASPLCLVDGTEMPVLNKLVDGGEYYVGGGCTVMDAKACDAATSARRHPDFPITWAFDPRVLLHEPSSHRSPETPHRLARAVEMLQQSPRALEMLPCELRGGGQDSRSPSLNLATFTKPRLAENEEILAWHDRTVYDAFLTSGAALRNLKSDVYCNEGTSSTAVKLSAAAVIDGGDAVLQSVAEVRRGCDDGGGGGPLAAMCLVRPPGHHCTATQPGGFCLVNNVAVASQQLLQRQYCFDGGASRPPRIAILDLDVHFGEGTAEFVEEIDRSTHTEPRHISYMSLHRYDHGTFYPSDVRGATSYHGPSGQHCIFNVAVDTHASDPTQCEKVISDHVLCEAVRRAFIPLLNRFQPDLVIVSQGFDAAYGDPLGRMAVEGGFALAMRMLKNWCCKDSSHPTAGLLVALEGGYSPESVSQGIVSIAYALTFPDDDVDVQRVCQEHCPRTWLDVRQKVQRRLVEKRQIQAESGVATATAGDADGTGAEFPSDEVLRSRHVQWCAELIDEVCAEFGITIE